MELGKTNKKKISCIFLSPFLLCKDNKVFILSQYDMSKYKENIKYENELYYLEKNELEINNIVNINNNIIDYSILNYDAPIFPQSTENVLIKINIDNNIDNNNIIKIMYTIDSHISGMNNLDEIYKNTDNSIIELYNNRYFKC